MGVEKETPRGALAPTPAIFYTPAVATFVAAALSRVAHAKDAAASTRTSTSRAHAAPSSIRWSATTGTTIPRTPPAQPTQLITRLSTAP